MALAHVAQGDPHVASHNEERDAINATQAEVDALAPVAVTGVYNDLTGKPTLGTAASKNVGTAAGTVAAGDDARFKAVGTAAGTVAAGDDTRIVGAAQKSANLSDMASPSTARTNIEAAGSTGGGREKTANLSATTGTATGDLNTASLFKVVPTGAIALAFTNIPASGIACSVRIRVSQGATPYAVTMPAGTIHWYTAAPTQTANKRTVYEMETDDAGANWDVWASVEG